MGASRQSGSHDGRRLTAAGAGVRYALPAAATLLALVPFFSTVDPTLTRFVDELVRPVKPLFRTITKWGESDWIFVLCALALLGLYLLLRRQPPYRLQTAAKLVGDGVWFVVFAVAGSGLLVQAIKHVIGRARPKYLETLGPENFSPFLFDSSHASFPSGHTATAFAMATVVLLIWRRWAILAYALAALIGFSRMATHSHYFSDVIAGAIIGVVFTLLVRRLMADKRRLFAIDRQGMIGVRGGNVARQFPRDLVAFIRRRRHEAEGTSGSA